MFLLEGILSGSAALQSHKHKQPLQGQIKQTSQTRQRLRSSDPPRPDLRLPTQSAGQRTTAAKYHIDLDLVGSIVMRELAHLLVVVILVDRGFGGRAYNVGVAKDRSDLFQRFA